MDYHIDSAGIKRIFSNTCLPGGVTLHKDGTYSLDEINQFTSGPWFDSSNPVKAQLEELNRQVASYRAILSD